MPSAPPTICHCGGRKVGGKCERCGPRKHHKQTTTQRGLGWAWQKLRGTRKRPGVVSGALCKDCEEKGLVRPAVEGHHMQKRVDRPDLALDPENIRPLCEECHDERTARGE